MGEMAPGLCVLSCLKGIYLEHMTEKVSSICPTCSNAIADVVYL